MFSYDEVEYHTEPVVRAHPDHLHVVGRLFGLHPPMVATARVLELGCGDGGNLIPLSQELRAGEFLGVDLSESAIRKANERIKSIGATNIKFECRDLLEFEPAEGSFDYIIAHGLYSWVPDAVKDRILKIIRSALSPAGIAFVSYNCFPGWHQRCLAREFMILHTAGIEGPKLKVTQARAALGFLAESSTHRSLIYRMQTAEERDTVAKLNDWHFYHDYLSENNDPRYFLTFIDEAMSSGLQYLGDAELSQMLPLEFPQEVQDRVTKIAGDVLRLEQYLDFLRNRMFRRTLLVRDDVVIRRELRASDLETLAIASPMNGALQPAGHYQFSHPNGGGITSPDPAFAKALLLLRQKYPTALPFDSLCAECGVVGADSRRVLSSLLMKCAISDLIDLRSR